MQPRDDGLLRTCIARPRSNIVKQDVNKFIQDGEHEMRATYDN